MNVYLDYNATAPLCEEAQAAIVNTLKGFGNPSSQHAYGRTARAVLEKARADIAKSLGANHDEILFTSSATEAAQMVIKQDWDNVIVNSTEHSCVLNGTEAKTITVDTNGHIDLNALEETLKSVDGQKNLVVVMAANNETGVLQPVQAISDLARKYGATYFCDAVQLIGKYNCTVRDISADIISFSAHKVGGAPGIGALWIKPGIDLKPLIRGGGQEMNRRAGTENILGAVSFAAALKVAHKVNWHNTQRLRDMLEQIIMEHNDNVIFFGQEVDRLPNTSCFALRGWKSETQLMAMDLKGFAISAGSACSSGKITPSHVLLAMGVQQAVAQCAVRVSLTPYTTQVDVESFAQIWLTEAQRIRSGSV
jgi:cysteine desulfurase